MVFRTARTRGMKITVKVSPLAKANLSERRVAIAFC